ncbi:B9 domain-containing protein 1 [Kappamyces sp. JEL0680]|nr:B9 domain-containing protein 1 [Kappamyces sp. JEL0680]
MLAALMVQGLEEGISQLAKGMEPGFFTSDYDITPCVWNFPIDIAFKSTNVFVTVYGFDFWGRDVVRGYGSLRLPLAPGRYTEYVSLFTPVTTTPFNGLYGWLTGRLPEFLDPKFAAKEEGREMTRVASNGTAKVSFTIITKDMDSCGYIADLKNK